MNRKTENVSKMVWVQPIPDSSKERHLSLKIWSLLYRKRSSYKSIRTEGSVSRSKSFVISKLSKEFENLS